MQGLPGDCILAAGVTGQLLFNRRARLWIAFWPQSSPVNCLSTAGLACGLHLGRRTRLGIAFWLQGDCILDKRFRASNCFC